MKGTLKISWKLLLAIVLCIVMFLVMFLIVQQGFLSPVLEKKLNIGDFVDLILGKKREP